MTRIPGLVFASLFTIKRGVDQLHLRQEKNLLTKHFRSPRIHSVFIDRFSFMSISALRFYRIQRSIAVRLAQFEYCQSAEREGYV